MSPEHLTSSFTDALLVPGLIALAISTVLFIVSRKLVRTVNKGIERALGGPSKEAASDIKKSLHVVETDSSARSIDGVVYSYLIENMSGDDCRIHLFRDGYLFSTTATTRHEANFISTTWLLLNSESDANATIQADRKGSALDVD